MTLASLQRGRKYVIDDVNAADPDELGTTFFTQVAQVYQDQRGDLESARLFYTKAMEYDPTNLEVKDKGRELARDTGDFKAFAEIESDLIPTVENLEERICRAYELAFTFRVCIRKELSNAACFVALACSFCLACALTLGSVLRSKARNKHVRTRPAIYTTTALLKFQRHLMSEPDSGQKELPSPAIEFLNR